MSLHRCLTRCTLPFILFSRKNGLFSIKNLPRQEVKRQRSILLNCTWPTGWVRIETPSYTRHDTRFQLYYGFSFRKKAYERSISWRPKQQVAPPPFQELARPPLAQA